MRNQTVPDPLQPCVWYHGPQVLARFLKEKVPQAFEALSVNSTFFEANAFINTIFAI